jgi:hypothetical protein
MVSFILKLNGIDAIKKIITTLELFSVIKGSG